MSSAATMSLSPEMVQELLEKHRVTLLESLGKMLAAAPAAPATAPEGKKSKKVKKEVDPNAPPKEKRAPNSWILFAMRVEKLVRAAEESQGKTTKETRLHTIVIKQFAASLKEKKGYDEWTDDEVTEALATWTPPEVSKHAAAKAAKAAEADAPEPAAEESAVGVGAPGGGAAAEKPKRQWSEEAKAAAALKRAATKAAKSAAAGGAAEPAAAAEAPAAAKKTITIKPKVAPAPAAAEKPVDLSFYSWTHEGKSYFTNDRGDVVTEDFEWVGRFNGTKIDESVPEPEDLATATLRE